ncbi:cytochrome P450 [Xylariaceae sp. FL0662B]|nr:cytochrome P450 [Xylariaceae sp. FL0662B]
MAPQLDGVLSSPFLVPILAGLFALGILYSYISTWYRLRHIDGPWLAGWTYLWMLRVTLTGEQSARYRAVNQKYGPLVRIGPNDVITDDPVTTFRMGAARSPYGRSSWYDAMRMDPYHPSLFCLQDTAAHDRLKARLAFGYGGRENPDVERDVDVQLEAFLALIRRKYLSTDDVLRPMDFAIRVNFFTLDAITKIAYGKAFGFLESDSDVHGYIESSKQHVPMLVVLGDVPWLSRLFFNPYVLRFLGPKTTDKRGMGKMMAVAQQVAGERFGPDAKDRKDMLGSFVRHGLTRRECESEILFQLIAGSDTTATAIRGTMVNVLASPLVYVRLRKEVDDAVAAGRVSSPIQVDEARQLEYLQAVIYEGLRMNPPFTGLVMKKVPPGGDTILGKHVPAGARVAHNFLSTQRSVAVFGPDAELFRPERWLGIDEGRRRDMAQTVELVFGYGRWGCSGKSVAFMELNKVYFELFRYFDFVLMNPRKPMAHVVNTNMFFQSGMWVKVTERQAL